MGKYIRKSKKTGEVAIMEKKNKTTESTLGVCTRAALKNLQKKSSSPPPESWSYMQLRSRRLEKLSPIVFERKRQRHLRKDLNLQSKGCGRVKQQQSGRGISRSRLGVKSVEEKKEGEEKGCLVGEGKLEEAVLKVNQDQEKKGDSCCRADLGVEEDSFGENVLEFEGIERTTRESTPCSLIRDPDTIKTPGSSTRSTFATDASSRGENSMRRHIPTAHEMNEFFTGAEEQQQKQFVEKYNFDPINEKPLPGRYEWEKVKHR